jgi:hypothetical protein
MEKIQPDLKCISSLPKLLIKDNQIRHSMNLALLTGFYHGLFYWLGVYQPNRHNQKNSKMRA